MGILKKDFVVENIDTIVENTLGGIGVFELKNQKLEAVYLNDGFYRMLGYSKAECAMFLKNIEANIIHEDLEVFRQGIADVLKDDGWSEIEFRTVTKDGNIRWLQVRGNLFSRNDESSIINAIILDATERKNIELELAEQAERLHLLSEAENEMIFDYNAKTDVLIIKAAMSSGKDILKKDYIHKDPHDSICEEDRPAFMERLEAMIKRPQKDSFDIKAVVLGAEKRWYRINYTSVLGNEGYVTRVVGRITDIHEQKLKELQMEEKAERDPLTGVYNKGTSHELIEAAIKEGTESGTINAVLMLDLDNFKAVNDNLGHAMGDSVLIDAAKHLKDNFKGRDIIGRMGGDEFIVFISDVEQPKNAQMLACKLNRLLTLKYPCDGGVICVTASIGIAFSGIDGDTFQELYEKADKALYATKKNGKNGCTIYKEGM